MPANTPEEAYLLLVEALNAGDVDAALTLCEPEATFMAAPGQQVTGLDAIREQLNVFLEAKPRLTLDVPQVTRSGDLALLCSHWTLQETRPDGRRVDLTGQGAEVVRRQADGTWKIVLSNPFPCPAD
jgi:uncharacterized protein (TIGR02246 family)